MPKWDGAEYHRRCGPQFSWAVEFSKRIDINPGSSLLDFGCGSGLVTHFFVKTFSPAKVLAIDVSESMIAAANKNNEFPTTIEFKCQSILDLTVDRVFDYATSFSCLHWILDKRTALANVFRALRPGAAFYLYFAPDVGHVPARIGACARYAIARNAAWAAALRRADFRPYHTITRDEAVALLRGAGFDVARAEVVRPVVRFPDRDSFRDWIATWSPFLAPLAPAQRPAFLEALVDRFLEVTPPDGDGRVVYAEYNLEVIARRPE